jgi:hypothetical protein
MSLTEQPHREGSKSLVWALLLLVTGGVALLAFSIPPESRQFLGVGFIVIGALNLVMRRRFGKHTVNGVSNTLSARLGEGGAQRFYLGLGLVLVFAGCILLISHGSAT